MEFFAVAGVPAPPSFLQRYVRVDTLARLCRSIDRVLAHEGERGDIYCAWGQFRVHRELLRDGVRFTLPTCLNALQWTVTAERRAGLPCVVIHCSINRPAQDRAFVESIEQFVQDWKDGLEQELERLRAQGAPRRGAPSTPWYG